MLTQVVQGQETAYEVIACTLIKLSPERYVVSLSDISNQVRLERKLNVAECWFASLLEGSSDFGVASLDRAGKFASVSPAISKQTGFAEADILGQELSYLEDETAAEHQGSAEQLAIAAREGWHLHENWHRHKDGSKVWYQRLVAVRHSQEEPLGQDQVCEYTVVLREGKPRSVDLHKLKQMLTRDHLTGAYNRMHLFEALEKESLRKKRYGQATSFLMVDVDFFKQVNDAHGHAAGDLVLQRFAKTCMALLRPVDTFARMGGGEFAILLPSTILQGATLLAERLCSALANSVVEVPGASLRVTASFGCSELNEMSDTGRLLADADVALYQAKQAGRNTVVAYGTEWEP